MVDWEWASVRSASKRRLAPELVDDDSKAALTSVKMQELQSGTNWNWLYCLVP
jgi:hypothetical protein